MLDVLLEFIVPGDFLPCMYLSFKLKTYSEEMFLTLFWADRIVNPCSSFNAPIPPGYLSALA